MTDLGDLNYAELLAHLRKDLQLNLSTDAQPNRLPDMGQTVAGQGVVWDGTQWVAASAPLRAANNLSDVVSVIAAMKNLGLTWGAVNTGATPTIATTGSGDWSISSGSTGVATIAFPSRVGPVPIAMPINTGGVVGARATGVSASSFTLETYSSTAVLTNSNCAFVVIGV